MGFLWNMGFVIGSDCFFVLTVRMRNLALSTLSPAISGNF